MNALSSALIGMTAYAVFNVIVAHKLVGVSVLTIIPIFALIVSVGTFIISKIYIASGQTLITPNMTQLLWVILIGVIIIIADIAFLSAYGMKGASVPMLTTTAALLPIMVALIEKIFITGTMPSLRTCFAFILSIFVVWLVAYDPANVVRQ